MRTTTGTFKRCGLRRPPCRRCVGVWVWLRSPHHVSDPGLAGLRLTSRRRPEMAAALGLYLALLALAGGMGVAVAAIGAALGQGRVGAAALEGIARQPEAAGRIQTAMIIALALIESLAIYALLVSLIILFVIGLPTGAQVIELMKSAPAAG